ncbi:hypothetical protein YPPY46_4308, partial [Yersinia pestis PY-46]
MITPRGP